ncbi:MAG: AAA family ATPase [Oscillospiraceae bacterium]|nr:AAA family ATPase [Oscillospiraceae bacterium]
MEENIMSLTQMMNDLYDARSEEAPAPPKIEMPKPPDIGASIREVMSRLALYRPEDNARHIIEKFITFRIRTKGMTTPEQRMSHYNLMLICEEPNTAVEVTEIFMDVLGVSKQNARICTEAEALRRSSHLLNPETKLLLIYDCQEVPRLNIDGNGSAREESRKRINAYHELWEKVADHVRDYPETMVFVSSCASVYRSSLRPNTALSRRLCAGHVHLRELSVESLLEECLDNFRKGSIPFTPEFEEALRAYFPTAYRVSDLRGRAFVENLTGRLYTRYFCRPDTTELTPECIPDDNPKFQSVEDVLGNIDGLVGLQAVKEEFSNMYKLQMAGLAEKDAHYHMIFAGNPGTGKTTVARMAADLLYSMNIIQKNKLVVAKPSDLVSEWVGGTGTKAMEVIKRAYGGVLFIDEAYGIATMNRGDELLNVLMQEMENNSHKLVVILAGYSEEMRALLKANPGLSSRIGRQIQFEDYTQEELAEIFLSMCKKEAFTLHPSARDELDDCIAALMTKEFFGNARDIRNMLQELKEAWSEDYYERKLVAKDGSVPMTKIFYPRHFEKIMPPKKQVSISDLVGLDTMKSKLESFKRQALYQKYLREKGFTGLSDFSMHMIFTGNPGTGKTTVAKLIADDLYAVGMLKTNRLVVAERKDLISAYGETGTRTADVIRKAVGGVLFIDEAYSLADNGRGGRGNECIEVLLTAMEEHKSDTVFIFAGYVEQMQDFLAMNPGLRSRIGYTFHFEDYSAEELTEIYSRKMRGYGFSVTPSALEKVRTIMEYFQDVQNFGNGRFVDHVIHQTINQRANRDFTKNYRSIQVRDIPSMKLLIDTAPDSMRLYDPAEVTREQQFRTAIHELGHAIVMVATDPDVLPERVSVRGHAGSYGRVTLQRTSGNYTEEQLLNTLCALLGGKNAEQLIFTSHDTGCYSDYERAKRLAGDMVNKFAMTTYGDSPKAILETAHKRSTELLSQYKDRLPAMAEVLMKKKDLTGKEFVKLLNS